MITFFLTRKRSRPFYLYRVSQRLLRDCSIIFRGDRATGLEFVSEGREEQLEEVTPEYLAPSNVM